jgi:hypothetical protein
LTFAPELSAHLQPIAKVSPQRNMRAASGLAEQAGKAGIDQGSARGAELSDRPKKKG